MLNNELDAGEENTVNIKKIPYKKEKELTILLKTKSIDYVWNKNDSLYSWW